MTERIDHAAKALDTLDTAYVIINGQSMASHELAGVELSAARLHATLALVEQQRIANIIALAQGGHGGSMGVENIALDALRVLKTWGDGPFPQEFVELRPEIAAALGVGESDEK